MNYLCTIIIKQSIMNEIKLISDFIKTENEPISFKVEINYLSNLGIPVEVFACNDLKKLKSFAKNVSKLCSVNHVIIKNYVDDTKICGY